MRWVVLAAMAVAASLSAMKANAVTTVETFTIPTPTVFDGTYGISLQVTPITFGLNDDFEIFVNFTSPLSDGRAACGTGRDSTCGRGFNVVGANAQGTDGQAIFFPDDVVPGTVGKDLVFVGVHLDQDSQFNLNGFEISGAMIGTDPTGEFEFGPGVGITLANLPELPTWAGMIMGFGGIGMALRRRSRAALIGARCASTA